MSPAVLRSRPLAAVSMCPIGCLPVSAARSSRCARRGGPGGFIGESGDVLVGVVGVVELCDGLWSEELFGCDVEAVGVALDRLEEPGCPGC
jgi:hypothetical protein